MNTVLDQNYTDYKLGRIREYQPKYIVFFGRTNACFMQESINARVSTLTALT